MKFIRPPVTEIGIELSIYDTEVIEEAERVFREILTEMEENGYSVLCGEDEEEWEVCFRKMSQYVDFLGRFTTSSLKLKK